MSGLTIEQEIGAGAGGVQGEEGRHVSPENGQGIPPDSDIPSGGGSSIDLSFLKAPTGEGPIEKYMDHPLNFNSSRGVARVLRGMQGLVGDMNYALVDVVIGALDCIRGLRSGTD